MTTLEQLRLGVALAHAVPGTELRLRSRRGQVVVSGHPAADLTPCAMRRIVLLSMGSDDHACSVSVDEVEVGGALVAQGGGLYQHHRAPGDERWFPTLLDAATVAEALAAAAAEREAWRAVHARLRADPELGVTAVVLTTEGAGASSSLLDAVAVEVVATCTVAELLAERGSAPHGGSSRHP